MTQPTHPSRWRRGESTHLLPCPVLSRTLSSLPRPINQSPSFLKSRRAAHHTEDGEKARCVSIHTQLRLPQPRRVTSTAKSRYVGPPSPFPPTSPPIPETCITRIFSFSFFFLRYSQENLYLIYGQFIMEIDHTKYIQMCRTV